MATHIPDDWLLFTADRTGQSIDINLIAINTISIRDTGLKHHNIQERAAYGGYRRALERVDCSCYKLSD